MLAVYDGEGLGSAWRGGHSRGQSAKDRIAMPYDFGPAADHLASALS